MHLLGHRLARYPLARAFLAGAAILAGATSPSASPRDAGEEVAFAAPRGRNPGAPSTVLPRPLAADDATRVRRIFAAQARDDVPAAVAETAHLTDSPLLGHILADRYLRRATPVGVDEAKAWLASYAGLPDAPMIRAGLLTPPSDAAALPAPSSVPARADAPVPFIRTIARNPVLDRSVREPARAGATDRALRLIVNTRGLDAVYGAQLRAEVAQALFTQGRDTEALRVAEAAHRQAKGAVGLAPYVAGLAAWRLGRIDAAGRLFEAVPRADVAPDELRAAGAFWAARARLRGPNSADATPLLQLAASNAMTFYGLLASQLLGEGRAALRGALAPADIDAVLATPEGLRALALVQVGQPTRAAAELRLLWRSAQDQSGLRRSVLLVARAAGLDSLVDEMAPLAKPMRSPSTEKLPSPRLNPTGGFRIDPAMVYAVARVESNFDAKAISPVGARGLMQIMPTTADHMVKRAAAPEYLARRLDEPASNLDLGQRYILHLAEHDAVDGDLIRLLVGYNAGPSNLRAWEGTMRYGDDPLLFIEAIPNDETRAYIPRVLAYTWLYAAQLRLPTPSLDQLAAGNWPRFTSNGSALTRLN